MSDQKDHNHKYCNEKECSLCGLGKLHADVRDSIIILKRIDQRSEKQSEILDITKEKIEVIENIATQTAKELSNNTAVIAENMRDAAIANRDLVQIIAGKKQVPISIFVIVLGILALVEFIILVAVFGIHLKFGSVIFGGEIMPKLLYLIGG